MYIASLGGQKEISCVYLLLCEFCLPCLTEIFAILKKECEQWICSCASSHVLICTANCTFNIVWKAKFLVYTSASAKDRIDGSFCDVSTTKI